MEETGTHLRAIVLDLKEKLDSLSPREICNQLTLLYKSINNEDVQLFSFDVFEDSGSFFWESDKMTFRKFGF